MRRFIRRFGYGEKGFTMIELLVVVAMLGVLAAVAIPNIGKFIGSGKSEAADTELHNVQVAVIATMADQDVGTIAGTAPFTLSATSDVTVGTTTVGAFLVGGNASLHGTYSIAADGAATQTAYP